MSDYVEITYRAFFSNINPNFDWWQWVVWWWRNIKLKQ